MTGVAMKAFLVGACCAASLSGAYGQGLHAVRALSGYVCMSLSRADETATQQSQLPPVLAAPNANSARLGYPTGIVFVKSPPHRVGNYVEMVRLNGQEGWIDVRHLRPWRSANGRPATCVPSLMSNGLLGTQIK